MFLIKPSKAKHPPIQAKRRISNPSKVKDLQSKQSDRSPNASKAKHPQIQAKRRISNPSKAKDPQIQAKRRISKSKQSEGSPNPSKAKQSIPKSKQSEGSPNPSPKTCTKQYKIASGGHIF